MPTRRDLIKQAAALGACALVRPSAALDANETVHVGLIGFGGRCRHLLGALKRIPQTRVTSVCDVWDDQLAAARKTFGDGIATTKDHRALLDRRDVDAVIIATPDHWHCPITIDACDSGKHVYVEKPLTHDLSEGAAVIAAAQKAKTVVQVGMQQRSMPHLQEALEIVRGGKLGHVYKCHLTWNRNTPRGRQEIKVDPAGVDWKRFLGSAKDQPFDPYRFRQWRWFWDFGGGLFTDLMVHWMDVVNWYLDLGAPHSAAALGDHFHSEGTWETPDTVQTLVRYPDKKLQVYFEGTFVNHRNRAMTEFMGTEATLYIDRGRYEIHPENSKEPPTESVIGQGGRGLDFYEQPDGELLHLTNWIDCIRSNSMPRCPVEVGVQAVLASHLANKSLRSCQIESWTS